MELTREQIEEIANEFEISKEDVEEIIRYLVECSKEIRIELDEEDLKDLTERCAEDMYKKIEETDSYGNLIPDGEGDYKLRPIKIAEIVKVKFSQFLIERNIISPKTNDGIISDNSEKEGKFTSSTDTYVNENRFKF